MGPNERWKDGVHGCVYRTNFSIGHGGCERLRARCISALMRWYLLETFDLANVGGNLREPFRQLKVQLTEMSASFILIHLSSSSTGQTLFPVRSEKHTFILPWNRHKCELTLLLGSPVQQEISINKSKTVPILLRSRTANWQISHAPPRVTNA